MAKLKAYTTIEALISSVLILMVISISTIVVLNVISSGHSTVKFQAKCKLYELALNEEELSSTSHQYELFRIDVSHIKHQRYNEIDRVTLTAYDNHHVRISQLEVLNKSTQ